MDSSLIELSVPLDVPQRFIAAVEEAGLVDLAERLRSGDFTTPEISSGLQENPDLHAEFAGYVQDWLQDNNFPEDEAPGSYAD